MSARRRLAIGIAVVAMALAAGLWILLRARQPGGSSGGMIQGLKDIFADTKGAVEQWCGKRLLAIADAHLRPQLAFERLEYEYPATVILHHVKLIDQGVTVIDAKAMRIEFTDAPKVGQPMVIQTVELTDPVVRLIRQENGQFLGVSDLVERPASAVTAEGFSVRPSDVFAIRRIGIINGTVQLEIPQRPAMTLDQLTFDLTSSPLAEHPQDKGWYAIDAHFNRPAVLDWSFIGRLNIDQALLDLKRTTWEMKLAAERYSALPPELQAFVRQHEITGDFSAQITGTLALRDLAASSLQVQALLTGGHMAVGEYVLPVQSLDFAADLSGGALTVKPFLLAGLGGTVQLDGTVQIRDQYPFTLQVDARGLRIEEALMPTTDRPSKYAGRIDLFGLTGGQMRSLSETANGTGNLSISEGRLVHIPLLAHINRLVGGAAGEDQASDQGSADLQLFGNRLRFTDIDLVSSAVAARGEGEIMFDSTIDFRLNAGPLERVQEGLGRVGELLGKVTGKLVRYDVTGTLGEPIVTVKPLGFDLGIGN